MINVRSLAVSLVLFAFAGASCAQAKVQFLFQGSQGDPGFVSIQAAAAAAVPSGKRSALIVRDLWRAFPERAASELASIPAERLAQRARQRWPKDETFVVTPDAARIAGTEGLAVAVRSILHASSTQRRALWRQNHGLLFAGGRAGPRRPAGRPASLGQRNLKAEASTTGQTLGFSADSDLCATFSRNGIAFDQVCGYGPGRGINIAVINQITGEIEEIYDFDTWIDAALATQYAVPFIGRILPERLVMVAVADANDLDQIPTAVAAFQQRFGSVCVAQVDFRDSWAAISQSTKTLAEQCNAYTDAGNYVDSFVQYSLQAVPSIDTTPPIGTFRINSGATATNSNLVSLDFTGITDSQSGLIPGGKVRLSNDGTNWSPMLDFSASQNWVLDRGNGPKTVYAQFRDRAGNWTATQTATITLEEETPLRTGPNSEDFAFYAQYCAMGTTILALSGGGSVATSPDLGSDWSAPQIILPSINDYGWDQVFVNCNSSGAVLATGFSMDENGNLLIATNSSSDGGSTWNPTPTANSFTFNVNAADYDYPSVGGVCSASPSNLVIFVTAPVGQNDQMFALASQDAGANWPGTPTQLTSFNGSAYLDTSSLETVCNNTTVVAAVNSPNGVNVYRSVNGGGAFTEPGNPVSPDASSYSLVVDPDGRIILLASSPSDSVSGYSLTAQSSSDGGATWTLPVLVAEPLMYSDYYELQALSPAPGLICAAWPDQVSADGSEAIFMTLSKDGGLTWSSPASIAVNSYWYSFMLAEKPSISSFEMAANATGDVELIWVGDRQGLGGGYAVQRFGVSAAARGAHEDSDIQGITDIYVATSTNYGAAWTITGPLEPSDTNGVSDEVLSLSLSAGGTAVAIWEGVNTYLDVRFLNGTSLPLVDPGGPVNAASLMSGNLAPGSMAIVSGQNLAASAASAHPPNLPDSLAGSSIRITDSSGASGSAALYSAAGGQISFVLPDSVAPGGGQMQITTTAGSVSVPIAIADSAPGLFSTTGDGTGTVAGWTVQTLADGSVQVASISPSVPITIGPNTVSLQLTVLATGVHHASNVLLMAGGIALSQVEVSQSTGWPGVDQVSGLVPNSLSGAGTVSVYLIADGNNSNLLNLPFN